MIWGGGGGGGVCTASRPTLEFSFVMVVLVGCVGEHAVVSLTLLFTLLLSVL